MDKLKFNFGLLLVLLILLREISADLFITKVTLVGFFIIWILFDDQLVDFWNSL